MCNDFRAFVIRASTAMMAPEQTTLQCLKIQDKRGIVSVTGGRQAMLTLFLYTLSLCFSYPRRPQPLFEHAFPSRQPVHRGASSYPLLHLNTAFPHSCISGFMASQLGREQRHLKKKIFFRLFVFFFITRPSSSSPFSLEIVIPTTYHDFLS